MNIMKKALLGVALVSSLGLSTAASATPFGISGGSFTPGSGYGTGDGQLDVTFTSLVAPQNFHLGVGDIQSFLFGRVTLRETCINTGIVFVDILIGCGSGGDERDNLGVTANLVFTSPLSMTVQNVAVTGAFAGPVGNGIFNISDFFIDFSPVRVNFGNGGIFEVDIGDLFFNDTGSITNGANVTLLNLSSVPEPAPLALLGIGLLGLAALRRRAAKGHVELRLSPIARRAK